MAPVLHYTARLVQTFVKLLLKDPSFPRGVVDPLMKLDPDERLPISAMIELLRGTIEMTGDQDIGLKAARMIEVGDYGAPEYAVVSASTVREALELLTRYGCLVNEALTATLEVHDGRATVRMDSAVVLPRASSDFQLAGFYWGAKQRKALTEFPKVDISFMHAQPDDIREYERMFVGETVRFSQPFDGMSFDAAFLDEKLISADPKLNDVIRKHAEALLAKLPRAQSITESVRELIAHELSRGDPSIVHVAKRLHMSQRTLARRLAEEGASFKGLIEELRRGLAVSYLSGDSLEISEVAFLLGFSDSPAFYRAFRRWTGQTPLAYRNAQRNGRG